MARLQFYRACYDCKNCGNEYYFLIVERDTKIPCARCNTDNSPTRQVNLIRLNSFVYRLWEKLKMKFNESIESVNF